MSSADKSAKCAETELLEEFALSALPAADSARLKAHLQGCARCSSDLQSIRATVDSMAGWPGEELRPVASLWSKVAGRIRDEGVVAEDDAAPEWPTVEWEEPAPGVHCKVLAIDSDTGRVSLIVRLDPNAEYPPHTHAGVEELHLLDGELWIDDRKLYPGEFNLAHPGTADARVWSETGCACVLITSVGDRFR